MAAASGPQVDASEVLAAALEQMDGIIAGTKFSLEDGLNDNHSYPAFPHHINGSQSPKSLSSLANDLKIAIENLKHSDTNENKENGEEIDQETREFLLNWLKKPEDNKPKNASSDSVDLQDKASHLEAEKEHLQLQVSVLTEQVEAQSEKVRELESALEKKKEHLDSAEEMLRQVDDFVIGLKSMLWTCRELLLRSSLENTKLDLMSEVSNLRLRLSASEQDYRERLKKAENEIAMLQTRLAEKEVELLSLRAKLSRNGTVSPVTEYPEDPEIEKLKKALESVMIANEEKEKKIEELRSSLNRYRRLQDLVLSTGRSCDTSPSRDGNLGDRVPSHDSVLSSLSHVTSADVNKKMHLEPRVTDKPPPVPRLVLPPTSSTPIPGKDGYYQPSPYSSPVQGSVNSSPLSAKGLTSSARASSEENVIPHPNKTPPAKRHFSTIPRQQGTEVLNQIEKQLQQHQARATPEAPPFLPSQETSPSSPQSHSVQNIFQESHAVSSRSGKHSGVSFGKAFFKLRTGKRSSSAPELAQPEVIQPSGLVVDNVPHSTLSLPQGTSPSILKPDSKQRNKGIKRIFGKLKRTSSSGQDLIGGDFQRGGVRATAGPRLGWSQEIKKEEDDTPFPSWDKEKVLEWFHRLGLGMYAGECKKWVVNGEHLLKASASEMEKELGIKNYLHRKKLLLALQSNLPNKLDELAIKSGQLDHQWVTRWLDDVGLPQYKDLFFDARIDGRVLHFLTVEDLFNLKVTNHFHHISIRRGIQILREKKFDPHCLRRRSVPDENKNYTSSEVALWTNHRVMEWLKTVDLSEYAPNLRGSGVHGALMVFEPRFTAELLATLLSIPPSKTLLRRHLTTHFKQLVGPDLIQQKREAENQPGYVPLTPTAKVKAYRRGQFTLMKKKSKSDAVLEDYVCPMESVPKTPISASPSLCLSSSSSPPSSQCSPSSPSDKDKKVDAKPSGSESPSVLEPNKSEEIAKEETIPITTMATTNV